jgi:ABC-type transport system involved in multi-copper enzyme maturation permease subunit
MFGTIVRKEFLERLVSFRFFLATVLCVLLLPGLTYVRAREFTTRTQNFPKSVESHRRDVRRYPRELNWTLFGRVLDRPLNPLSILVEPADLRDGGEVELMWRDMPRYLRGDVSNPVPGLFPAFNALTFVTVVMSLLAIVFSFDALCGEKESGTLKLMLANAVPRGTVLAGKWLGGLVALLLPFALGSIVSAILLLVTMSGYLAPGQWMEMGGILLLSVLFLSSVYGAGVLVSTLTDHAATSAAALLLMWSLGFLVYPNLAPVVTEWLAPMPSESEYDEDVSSHQEQTWQTAYDGWERFLKEHPDIQKQDPNNYWVRSRERFVEEMRLFDREVEALNESYARRLEAQVAFASGLLRALPLGSYTLAVHELSGCGATERANFLTSVARYRNQFFDYFAKRSVEIMSERRDKKLPDLPAYTAGDFPLFAYRETGVAERLSRSLLDVVLLAAWNVLFFLASYMRFLRYDVS